MNTDKNISTFKLKALNWANQFNVCCLLDSNQYRDVYSNYDFVIAAEVELEFKATDNNSSFESLKAFYDQYKTWIFGFFSYDLKNETEDLKSENLDFLIFPPCYFFIPKYLIAFKNGQFEVIKGPKSILEDIENCEIDESSIAEKPLIKQRISKNEYLHKIKGIKEHILRGNIYEMNFCQEFYAENALINPVQVYNQLNTISPTPFSGYFKIYEHFILSATPERFLCKRGNKLISQPIKGTAKRVFDPLQDELVKKHLRNDIKEQTENVMIVDLVRHDLTKSAKKGTVKVEELFGIYTFPQVHQMISTISCELNPEIHFIDAIKNSFPMGSMTGAPKLSAMKLIETFEETKRGIYSGSFGCINPNGDFDFNVVIRSVLYNANNKYLSFQVGGAITYHSEAEKEYEECLTKASAIFKVLEN